MILLPIGMPLIQRLKEDRSDAADYSFALSQGQQKIKIGLLNLMPLKIETEYQFARLLTQYRLPIELHFLKLQTHTPKHTSAEHLAQYYSSFLDKINEMDILISTGAPIEEMPFEQVRYWQELKQYFTHIQSHHIPLIGVCWSGQAALKHYRGIEKENLPQKQFGVFETTQTASDEVFSHLSQPLSLPVSRHSHSMEVAIQQQPQLKIILSSQQTGAFLIKDEELQHYYITGHPEYAADSLKNEYERDKKKNRADVFEPVNYNLEQPTCFWHQDACLLYHHLIDALMAKKTTKPVQ